MFPDPDSQHFDDASKHGRRVRNFRHERGNWASYVYAVFHPQEEFGEMLEEVIYAARKHGIVLTKMEEFHISLSQTVIFRHHWIKPFVQSLRERLCSVNRTFLGLEVSTGHQQLLDIVSEVDKSLQEFNLETFYENPSFHVSLAWCVGEVTKPLQGTCLLELQKVVDEFEDSDVLTRFYADDIFCKCGNKIMSIPLH
ncbi:U6 snRNA phosphodiesterase 1 isoform X2 [Hyla sarda]|uniref:U6 snRNA phosphodiesterase 1 isoform X2 n=1 Tax=Hyla sarda TaxID=327740 RepID=UPI0024C3C2E6|nr:U6 snRNA phosphodiesterase 1 isoform X2 [Hyla sarda]